MKIVVLCGGTSTEREVSLVTGSNVCKALREKGHKAILLDVFVGHENVDCENIFDCDFSVVNELEYINEKGNNIERLKKERREFFGPNVLKLCSLCDVVFMGLHGACGEDGRVQATFELMGIKYTGANYFSSAVAMDKAFARKILSYENVPVASGYRIQSDERVAYPEEHGIDYPVVVKPNRGGSSIGVYFANDKSEYESAVEKAFRYEDVLVVEQMIKGREFSIGVVNYEAFPVIEIIPKQGFYDYENKYKAGATIEVCPADIPDNIRDKMQAAAVNAARAIGLDTYCRVDVLLDEEGNCYCLEANTLPGMTPTSLLPQEAAVLGMDYPKLCEYLIEVSMKK